MNTIAIIGGGASGMAAALAARQSLDNRVLLLERQSRVGRKLLATGNGRCNLSNRNAGPDRYHGADPAFIGPAMLRFGVADTLAWFEGLGLMTRTEDSGRIYPMSDAAASVVDVLRLAMDGRGVESVCGFTAASARKMDEKFIITSSLGDSVTCDKLIIACGGAAGARLGGTRDGYDLLHSFGHGCTALHPSLVQLKTDNKWTRAMKGVRTQAVLTLDREGQLLAETAGEVQFTDYGVTGPAVFELSRAAALTDRHATLTLRLLPELSKVDIIEYMTQKCARFSNQKAENLLSGALHNSISRTVIRRAEIPLDARLWALSESDLGHIADIVTTFSLPLMGTLGFDDAQVTAGGVETRLFDPETMESRLTPGLYACGEVLDIDGDCGGFNLQWAWSGGRLAGLAAGGLLE